MENRIKKCIAKLKTKNLDAILLSNPTNITYLNGFREAEGYLLINPDTQPTYFTNFLYKYEAQKLSYCRVLTSGGNIFKLVEDEIRRLHLKNIGFEAKHLPFLEYAKFSDDLAAEGINFIKTIDFIENLRIIKSHSEVSLIKKAARITQEALTFIGEIHEKTMREKELSLEVEKFLKLKGDSQVAFPTIVASGRNSAFPHHLSGEAKLNKKFFLIDLGAKNYGYCADLTRVFFWGKMPPLFKKIYSIVHRAQELSIKKIKDGVKAKEVDLAARKFLDKKGLVKYFGHGVGHGIGLSVHEPPFLNCKNDEILKDGMVVTVEPAVYINGNFGIRIEDMVLVGNNKGEVL
ncbi:MAG: Xaa-Pro peptidase family protein [Candidatus Omnitrophota bacterium]|nr:Xaa-Pro peptidase family protein [Candidatus Omnitrophota bacterium]